MTKNIITESNKNKKKKKKYVNTKAKIPIKIIEQFEDDNNKIVI